MNAQQTTTFLFVMGYRKDEVEPLIARDFPGSDFETLWATAQAQHRESERELDAAVRKDDERALAAEHNLSESMHDRR